MVQLDCQVAGDMNMKEEREIPEVLKNTADSYI